MTSGYWEDTIKFGDTCRARSGAPARYLQDGWCLFVSCMSNDLCITKAAPKEGREEEFPLPDDEDLDKALIKLFRNEYNAYR